MAWILFAELAHQLSISPLLLPHINFHYSKILLQAPFPCSNYPLSAPPSCTLPLHLVTLHLPQRILSPMLARQTPNSITAPPAMLTVLMSLSISRLSPKTHSFSSRQLLLIWFPSFYRLKILPDIWLHDIRCSFFYFISVRKVLSNQQLASTIMSKMKYLQCWQRDIWFSILLCCTFSGPAVRSCWMMRSRGTGRPGCAAWRFWRGRRNFQTAPAAGRRCSQRRQAPL